MWARHKLHALHMWPVRLVIAIIDNLEIFFLNKKILKTWILLVCSVTPPHNGSWGIGNLSIPSKPKKGCPLTLTCRFHTKRKNIHGRVRQNMEKGNYRTVSRLTKEFMCTWTT
jgi:hypothetical protein